MLHYIANFVSLPCDAEEVVYRGLLKLSFVSAEVENNSKKSIINQSSKIVGWKIKNAAQNARELKETQLSDNFHFKQLISH